MKLIKPIYGVVDGEIYPVWIAAGETCPKELEAAAREIGAVQTKGKGAGDGGKAAGGKPAESLPEDKVESDQTEGGDGIQPATEQDEVSQAVVDGVGDGGK